GLTLIPRIVVMPTVNGYAGTFGQVARTDAALLKNGFEPVAVEGKRALGDNWSTRPSTIEAITAERASLPNAISTGLRTGRLVGVDIDVFDPDLVSQIRSLAFEVLGQTTSERV